MVSNSAGLMKSLNPRYWTCFFIGFLCLVVAGLSLTGSDSGQYASSPQSSSHDSAGKESTIGSAGELDEDLIQALEQQPSIEASADSLAPLRSKKPLALASEDDLPGLSPDELKLLHARQQQEIEEMLSDLDAVVIASANDGDGELTVRELRALHEQQKRTSSSLDDGAEIVILPSEDGSPALSVSDLRAIHAQQTQNFEATDDAEEPVIPGSEDGSGRLSRAELGALHARQRTLSSKGGDSLQDSAAPLPEAGDPYLTVYELQELHESQSRK